MAPYCVGGYVQFLSDIRIGEPVGHQKGHAYLLPRELFFVPSTVQSILPGQGSPLPVRLLLTGAKHRIEPRKNLPVVLKEKPRDEQKHEPKDAGRS